DAFDEAAPSGIRLARLRGIGVVEGAEVPPVGGDLRDGVYPPLEERPERLRVVRPAGEATADAHDADRFEDVLGGFVRHRELASAVAVNISHEHSQPTACNSSLLDCKLHAIL